MLRKTKGVVLSRIKYGDSSVIVRIYTKENGLQSYIIKGIRNKKRKVNLLQPLFLVEVESYHKQSRSLQFAKEFTTYYNYKSIPFDITKSAVILFITEILVKTLKEEEKNIPLFDFLESTLIFFDNPEYEHKNLHLFFVINLTKHLGFFPNIKTYKPLYFFDLTEGCFTDTKPDNNLFIDKRYCELFYMFCNVRPEDFHKINISKKDRNYILDKIMQYYAVHSEGFVSPKSLPVLTEVFS